MVSAMVEKICRTCMGINQKLYSIFEEQQEGTNVNIAMMLTEFTKYKVNSFDDLPQSICSACMTSVQSAYEFKHKCEESYLKLIDLLHERRRQSSTNAIKKETLEEEEMEIPKALQNISVSIRENKSGSDSDDGGNQNDDEADDGSCVENAEEDKQQPQKDFLQVFLNEHDNKTADNLVDTASSTEDDATSSDKLQTPAFSITPSNRSKQKNHLAELLKCDDCDKIFTKMGQLKSHKINRHGEKSHICEFCQKGFRTKINLKRHIVVHSKKRFICKGCSARYFTKEELDAHVKEEKHDKLKLCPECGLRCKTNDKLKVHMRRHTGEKPYKCRYCNKAFASGQEMRCHERCHTGKKSHFCNDCGKGFQKKYYLDKHSLLHHGSKKSHICSNCKMEFVETNDLKSHICVQINAAGGEHKSLTLLENFGNFN